VRLYKLLSVLLEYPTRELTGHLGEIEGTIPTLEQTTGEDREALWAFLAWARGLPLTELQAHYVTTFDLTPDNALYLTHHLFEEQDRARGPALVRLSEYFAQQGFEIDRGELPDYLPLILEYVSTLPDMANARGFLEQTADVANVLAKNLALMESPYAALLCIVARHGKISELAA
jgi:nitrate reductase molybdenum cofactor assembly chaperone NarJ/NarW